MDLKHGVCGGGGEFRSPFGFLESGPKAIRPISSGSASLKVSAPKQTGRFCPRVWMFEQLSSEQTTYEQESVPSLC